MDISRFTAYRDKVMDNSIFYGYGNLLIVYLSLVVLFKVFATTEIEDITFAEGVWTTVLLAAIIPLCATVAGIVITTRRKYR